jgi:hypothetical protein
MARIKRILLVVALSLLGVSCALVLPCLQKSRDRENWLESSSNLKYIALALHNYQETYGRLPPAAITGKDGKPLYSWRVVLLPFLEQNALFQQFHLDEPWDSPHNKPLLEKVPRYYSYPPGGYPDTMTRYQVFVGPGTAFERGGLTWDDFPDGTANTFLVVEAGEPVPWTKPVDLVYDPTGPLPPLGGGSGKPVHFLCYELWRNPGFVAAFADGKVRFIRSTTDERTIRALITRNGDEKVDVSKLE